jgi:uncharacterized protein (DUF2235 family)
MEGKMAKRRLIVCADGTWNKPDQDDHGTPSVTNVVKIKRAIKAVDAGISQIVYYHAGVGTGDELDKIAGGAFGAGLDHNIVECYQFLVDNYAKGDELYFFGFSRGAYTVRSLAGLIRNSGLLKQQFASMAEQAFSLYRDRDPSTGPNSDVATQFRKAFSYDITEIECIGVWDTVGALGVPIALFSPLNHHKFAFHDMQLSSRIKNAFQALAIDERRGPFAPTLWEQPVKDAEEKSNWLEQAWFSGVHSNVGGGYADCGLSDVTFQWMMNRVRARTKLRFDDGIVEQIVKPNPLGRLYESFTGPVALLGEHVRIVDDINGRKERPNVRTWEYVHRTAKERNDAMKARGDAMQSGPYAIYAERPDARFAEEREI